MDHIINSSFCEHLNLFAPGLLSELPIKHRALDIVDVLARFLDKLLFHRVAHVRTGHVQQFPCMPTLPTVFPEFPKAKTFQNGIAETRSVYGCPISSTRQQMHVPMTSSTPVSRCVRQFLGVCKKPRSFAYEPLLPTWIHRRQAKHAHIQDGLDDIRSF